MEATKTTIQLVGKQTSNMFWVGEKQGIIR